MASPPNWHAGAARLMPPPVRMRLHPGAKPNPNAPTLAADLAGARCCVVWSSSSGVKALISGIPVFYDAPHWICADAAVPLRRASEFEVPSPEALDELRERALADLAWAQWTVDELASGEPFALFRDAARQGDIAW